MKLTQKEKIELVETALKVITQHVPCYGTREEDPCYIQIGSGIQLRDRGGFFITSGTNLVARALIKRYGSNEKIKS